MSEKLVDIIRKPREMIGGAVRALKGPDVQGLVETFTGEMTVVAEGLYDDQMRLRREVEELAKQQEMLSSQVLEGSEGLEKRWEQAQKEMAGRLGDMQKRLQALEAKQQKHVKSSGVLSQITLLATIVAGAWIIVTLLNLLK